MATKPRTPRPGNLARIINWPRAIWRVTAVRDGLASLTQLNSFNRVDVHGITLERVLVSEGLFR